jgi:hypothetical protein
MIINSNTEFIGVYYGIIQNNFFIKNRPTLLPKVAWAGGRILKIEESLLVPVPEFSVTNV